MCKGVAIIAVVLGHVIEGIVKWDIARYGHLEAVVAIIGSFHMPLFIALPGMSFAYAYVTKKFEGVRCNSKGINNQLRNLIILYFMHSMLYWIFKTIFSGAVNDGVTIMDLLVIPIKSIQLFWYLYVMVILYISARGICYIWQNIRWVLIVSFIVSVIARKTAGSEYPIMRCVFYFFFFILGIYLILEKKYSILKKPAIILVNAMILGMLYITPRSMLSCTDVFWELRNVLIAVTASFAIVGCSQYIEGALKPLAYIGQHSLEIYLLHVYITSGGRIVLKVIDINVNVFIVLFTVLGIALPLLFSKMIRKTFLWKVLFKPCSILKKV